MFKFFLFISLFILTCLFVTLSFLKYLRRRLVSYFSVEKYLSPISPKATYEFLSITKTEKNLTSDEKKTITNHFQACFLVHGTFVGQDPFHLYGLLSQLFPEQGKDVLEKIQQYGFKNHQSLIKDFGNFNQDHLVHFKQNFGSTLPVEIFSWSSGNHHLARVNGAIDFLKKLVLDFSYGDRLLLIGHSHAGQIFALMSLFINNSLFRKEIKSLLGCERLLLIEKKIKILKSLKLTFVTLGAPPRYQWHLSRKMKLIHFINHRGDRPIGGSFSGLLTTRDGDYIQQWGIAGSDIKSPVKEEHELNQKLNQILGVGSDIKALRQNIKARKRLHNYGHHFLVDYQDNSSLPNFFKSALGHGLYTKTSLIDFHLSQIVKYLF